MTQAVSWRAREVWAWEGHDQNDRASEKVGRAAKKIILDAVACCGFAASIAVWAHEAAFVALDRNVCTLKFLAYGASFVVYGARTVSALRKMVGAVESTSEGARFKYLLLKALGNGCLLEWSALGLGNVCVPMTPAVLAPLFIGCVFSGAAYQYKREYLRKE